MEIKINLSEDSINQAIETLENIKRDLEFKSKQLMARLADEGFTLVVNNISAMGAYYTGELINSVSAEYDERSAIIRVVNEHAMFVEFGTGPVGAQTGYVGQLPDNWNYASGTTIGWYWVYGQVKFGWWYYDDYAQQWRFTEGMQSRPFMFNAAQELKLQKLDKIVKEVFND